MPFTNKTAIVTGAGGGMGLNIARDLIAGGARVTMIDLKRERPPDLPVDRALYLIGDVTEETFVYKAIAHAFHETGRLDYVVKVGTLRKLGGIRIGFEAIVLSIISLGMIDAIAMLPLSISATATSGSGAPRSPGNSGKCSASGRCWGGSSTPRRTGLTVPRWWS